jgi:signal peptidase
VIRRTLNALALAGLLLIGAGWFVFLRPATLGGATTWIIVRGDSMTPTYQTGDLIVFRSAASYGVGDVVAYHVPEGELGAGRIVMHRIIGGDANGLLVKGDNNPVADPWHPRPADIVGSVWLVGAQLGRPIMVLHQPAVVGALAASVMVVVLLGRKPSPGARRRFRGRGPAASGEASPSAVAIEPVREASGSGALGPASFGAWAAETNVPATPGPTSGVGVHTYRL